MHVTRIVRTGAIRFYGNIRGGPLGLLGFALIGTSVILVFFVVWGNSIFGAERTFVVNAKTSVVEISFDGSSTPWPLTDAVICRAIEKPRRDTQQTGSGRCSVSRYQEMAPQSVTILWAKGSRARVRIGEGDSIEILMLTDVGSIPANSIVFLSTMKADKIGSLPFTGFVTLGTELTGANPDMLFEGRFEARETDLLSRLSSRRTNVVKQGVLNSGDTAMIVNTDDGMPMLSFGHMVPTRYDDTPALSVTLASASGESALSITYFGGDHPIQIRPDWIDTAISNPYLIALTVLLGFLGNMLQAVLALRVNRVSP